MMPIPLHWHTEPLLLALVIGAGWAYLMLAGPLRPRLAAGEPFPWGNAFLFMLGLVVAYLTVASPLDQLGEDFLFSAHMVQHMLLMYLAPPLLLLGLPSWMADAVLAWRPLRAAWRCLVHPVVAGVSLTVLYTAWHVPTLYELALRDKLYHVIEHWCMFLPALWMWWAFVSPSKILPPITYGARLVFIFLLLIGQLPVFAFLTLSDIALYPTYQFAPRIVDLNALEDQILGGLIMKVTNMVVTLVMAGLTFYLWYRHDTEDAAAFPDVPVGELRRKRTLA